MSNLTPIIKDAFTQYAGAVLQNRALVDVRDCLKPSARQIFYCLYTDKFLPNKPFQKTLKAIGSAVRIYIHGDSSVEGILMRSSQDFAMRYPLIEVNGNNGHLSMTGSWASPRYTSSRLSHFSTTLFQDMEKNTVEEWRDNYDDTEKYPTVLPSKGFYNIVNGTLGIGIGAASSIPQFNLREVNEALIKLLWNPNISFDEIYCAPDFATGAILLNASEVKESLRNGAGKACKLRSVIEYDDKDNCLVVKEIPYGVYTNTICGEIDALLERADNPGIERYNDLTDQKVNIKIYLTKRAQPARVVKYLYKNTSLQSHYSINMTMLENGRFPKVFSWKEALVAHLTHEIKVYRRSYRFELDKAQERLHIVDGIIKAISIIEEVIECIKSSSSTADAKIQLSTQFDFSTAQSEAILKITLARLARLEITKYQNEKNELKTKIDNLTLLLNDNNLLYQEIEKGYRKVIEQFGDTRRTQIMDIEKDEEETPADIRVLTVHLTNKNNLYFTESSGLIIQNRGGVGKRIKLDKDEIITTSIIGNDTKPVIMFSSTGRAFKCSLSNLTIGEKISLYSFLNLNDGEVITHLCSSEEKDYFVFVTKNGFIKKTAISEYNFRLNGVTAIKLRPGDSLVSVHEANDNEIIAIATDDAHFVMFKVAEVTATGRTTSGMKAMTLKNLTKIACSAIINTDVREILTVTIKGYAKTTSIDEFSIGSRGNIGVLCHFIKEDKLAAMLPITAPRRGSLNVVGTKSLIKVNLSDIPSSSRNTVGLKTIKLRENEEVTEVFYE